MRKLVRTFDESLKLPDEVTELEFTDLQSCIAQSKVLIKYDVDWHKENGAHSVTVQTVTPTVWRVVVDLTGHVPDDTKNPQRDYYRIVTSADQPLA